MNNKINMTWDKEVMETPIGKAYEIYMSQPTDHFGKLVYKLNLYFDGSEYESKVKLIEKDIAKFHKTFSKDVGVSVTNKCIYKTEGGNYTVTFTVAAKGNNSPDCYDTNGELTVPPSDGDSVQVKYTIGGWYSDEGKAGIKVYLNEVVIHERVKPMPNTTSPNLNEDNGEDWL